MSRRRRRAFSLLMAMPLVAACQHELALPVTPDEPLSLTIRTGSEVCERRLIPSSPEYQVIRNWIAVNSTGWARYRATIPSQGIEVSAGRWRLWFGNGAALAKTDRGLFIKRGAEVESRYLKCPASQ